MYCSIRCLDQAWSLYHKWECPGAQMGMGQQIGIAHLSLKVLLNSATTEDTKRFDEVQKLVTNIDKIPTKDLLVYGIVSTPPTSLLRIAHLIHATIDYFSFFRLR